MDLEIQVVLDNTMDLVLLVAAVEVLAKQDTQVLLMKLVLVLVVMDWHLVLVALLLGMVVEEVDLFMELKLSKEQILEHEVE